ncbi:MAG TPA: hypothetical protein VFB79_16420 [Candidatus Angelobacter sp.]|nr:hypothetical protein [Candidatus Angelobacter sp.]
MSDEKKPTATQPNVAEPEVTVRAMTDMAAQYVEQQEQKRLDFEDRQEQKRQAFEKKLERQKATREWLMLIITVVAVAAAAWTAYEARKARIDAEDFATKTLQAQTAAMRLDERPYVKISLKEVQQITKKDGHHVLLFQNVVTAYGRTPAIHIEVDATCEPSTSPLHPVEKSGVTRSSMMAPGDSDDGFCEMPILTTLPDAIVVRHYGTVYYDDIFGKAHTLGFCWAAYYKPADLGPTTITQCPDWAINEERL